MNYYFIAISLPKLTFGEAPDISPEELRWLLDQNLSPKDKEAANKLFMYFDLKNLRSFWLNQPFNPLGNWDRYTLEAKVLGRSGIPQYLKDFLDNYTSTAARVEHFPELLIDYYTTESESNYGFLNWYFNFESDLRLVLTALRARNMGKTLSSDPIWTRVKSKVGESLLLQESGRELKLPPFFEPLGAIFEKFKNEPLMLDEAVDKFRFDVIDQKIEMEFFSIDAILAYLAQYFIVYKHHARDPVQGQTQVQQLMEMKPKVI